MEMVDVPQKSSRLQSALAVAIVFSSITVPVAVAYIGASFAASSASQQINAQLVQLAIGILREGPKPDTLDVREWAADVLTHHSTVPLPPSVMEQLSRELVLPGAQVVRVDVSVNDQKGLVVLPVGEVITFVWTSENATACMINTPGGLIGVTFSGRVVLDAAHPWYPPLGNYYYFTAWCHGADGSNASDTVNVLLSEQRGR